jgi:hypothetical protein
MKPVQNNEQVQLNAYLKPSSPCTQAIGEQLDIAHADREECPTKVLMPFSNASNGMQRVTLGCLMCPWATKKKNVFVTNIMPCSTYSLA